MPDLTTVDKKTKEVWIMDMAVLEYSRIEEKELEKITKFEDLQIEIGQQWQKKGSTKSNRYLECNPKQLEHHFNTTALRKITISQL